jgi:RNA polymerase sigma factor (sigma-70 family)
MDLTEQFEANRSHLRAVAYRMLGSLSEADDAVQEAWIRLHRTDTTSVENLAGWLTTVVSRVCLDMLRSRTARREEPLVGAPDAGTDPEQEAMLAASVGSALLVVLEMLAPAERIAFVLHDLFAVPFEEIGPIVGRSPDAARQLASRARRRVQGAPVAPDADIAEQRRVVDAFLAASRDGNFEGLLAVLDPDVVVSGAGTELRGASVVAREYVGRAQSAQSALVDGQVGVIVAPRGRLLLVLRVRVANGKIASIIAINDAEALENMELALLP